MREAAFDEIYSGLKTITNNHARRVPIDGERAARVYAALGQLLYVKGFLFPKLGYADEKAYYTITTGIFISLPFEETLH